MKRLAALAGASILVLAGVSGAAQAGETSLTNSKGKSVAIHCNGGGCYVNGKRVGDGGSSNFEKWVWRYGRKGYK